MKILITGSYDRNYNRTKILLNGLASLDDVSVCEYHFERQSGFDFEKFKQLEKDADWIYIPAFCHKDVGFIKKHSSTPIVFDPLISRYLTKVFDYKQVWKYSPRAVKNYFKDKIPFSKCDLLLADTQAHADYYSSTFKIKLEKIKVLPIGVEIDVFKNQSEPSENDSIKFNIGFYGGFIPLQGVENIVKAASILKNRNDIGFTLIGNGFEYEKIEAYIGYNDLDNVELKGWIDYPQLPNALNKFDLCLGIFGDTKKSDLVIPNKIYHYAASGKCIITKDSPAIREVFTAYENIILTSTIPEEIARVILEVKENSFQRKKIGQSGIELMQSKYSAALIAKRLVIFLKEA